MNSGKRKWEKKGFANFSPHRGNFSGVFLFTSANLKFWSLKFSLDQKLPPSLAHSSSNNTLSRKLFLFNLRKLNFPRILMFTSHIACLEFYLFALLYFFVHCWWNKIFFPQTPSTNVVTGYFKYQICLILVEGKRERERAESGSQKWRHISSVFRLLGEYHLKFCKIFKLVKRQGVKSQFCIVVVANIEFYLNSA